MKIYKIYEFLEDEDVNSTLQIAEMIVTRNQNSNSEQIENVDETRLILLQLIEQLRIVNKAHKKKHCLSCNFTEKTTIIQLFQEIQKQNKILEKRLTVLNLMKNYKI
jgi:hypothetical protein